MITPVFSSTYRTLCHVVPPSVVLNSPRSSLGPHRRPQAPTYTMLGSSAWIVIRPIWKLSRSPMFFHVFPPSVDLYTPSPHDTELRGFCSPVPTQTMFGSLGATATSPIDTVRSCSNWCSNVTPLFTVLRSPPEAVAAHQVLWSFSFTAIAVMRPPMLAGPMLRHWNALIHGSGSVPVLLAALGCAGGPAG
jgi:hypothetical protein